MEKERGPDNARKWICRFRVCFLSYVRDSRDLSDAYCCTTTTTTTSWRNGRGSRSLRLGIAGRVLHQDAHIRLGHIGAGSEASGLALGQDVAPDLGIEGVLGVRERGPRRRGGDGVDGGGDGRQRLGVDLGDGRVDDGAAGLTARGANLGLCRELVVVLGEHGHVFVEEVGRRGERVGC